MVMSYEDVGFFGRHINVDVAYVPGSAKAKKGSIGLGVSHKKEDASEGKNPRGFR